VGDSQYSDLDYYKQKRTVKHTISMSCNTFFNITITSVAKAGQLRYPRRPKKSAPFDPKTMEEKAPSNTCPVSRPLSVGSNSALACGACGSGIFRVWVKKRSRSRSSPQRRLRLRPFLSRHKRPGGRQARGRHGQRHRALSPLPCRAHHAPSRYVTPSSFSISTFLSLFRPDLVPVVNDAHDLGGSTAQDLGCSDQNPTRISSSPSPSPRIGPCSSSPKT
jgi:hypothetical protein